MGDAEVGELREPDPGGGLRHHDHVLRLHVAMDHPTRARMGKRLAEVGPDASHVAVGQRRARAARLGFGPERARNQIDVVLIGRQFVDPHDRRVVQPGSRKRLALHPLAAAALARIALTATSRSSSSQACQTTPKPPAPRRCSSR